MAAEVTAHQQRAEEELAKLGELQARTKAESDSLEATFAERVDAEVSAKLEEAVQARYGATVAAQADAEAAAAQATAAARAADAQVCF